LIIFSSPIEPALLGQSAAGTWARSQPGAEHHNELGAKCQGPKGLGVSCRFEP